MRNDDSGWVMFLMMLLLLLLMMMVMIMMMTMKMKIKKWHGSSELAHVLVHVYGQRPRYTNK